MDIYAKLSFISIFLFFLVSKHDFIRIIDFTRIAASNTASDLLPSVHDMDRVILFYSALRK